MLGHFNKYNKFKVCLIFLFSNFFSLSIYSQAVVVNGFFNESTANDEWTELLVINDNTDMRGWSIRDNNSSHTSWQTAFVFTNNSLWNNLRSGTVIMVWHRALNSGGVAHPIDVNKDDGYIEINVQNATYFSGGSGTSMDIAGTGDIIELLDASSSHVHALANRTTVGVDWTNMSTPKLNHANNSSSGDAIYVCPGAVITDYNGPATGNAFTSKNNVTITFGLPNTCGGSPTGNTLYWNLLREPIIANQIVNPTSMVPGAPGSISFTWSAATDPNPADATIGYIILRNTSNAFTAPSDGVTYVNGVTIGSATVLSHINASGTTTYTDNTVMNGNAYYYQIYAFKYATDNINGNSYNASRGRAYNQTNFVTVNNLGYLPIELTEFKAKGENNMVQLFWQTSSEHLNNYFTVERSSDGINFKPIGTVKSYGESNTQLSYNFYDAEPLNNVLSYYRLKQTDFDGKEKHSGIIYYLFNKIKNSEINLFPNPTNDKLSICCLSILEKETPIKITNSLGQSFEIESILKKDSSGTITFDVSLLPAGFYYISVIGENTVTKSFVISH
jgi:hypothetical protein